MELTIVTLMITFTSYVICYCNEYISRINTNLYKYIYIYVDIIAGWSSYLSSLQAKNRHHRVYRSTAC